MDGKIWAEVFETPRSLWQAARAGGVMVRRAVTRSGERALPQSSEADSPVAGWAPDVRDRFLDEVEGALESGVLEEVLIHVHASDIVSDIPGARAVASWCESRRAGLVIDSAAVLAPDMIANASDHLRRWTDLIAATGSVRCVVLSDATVERERTAAVSVGKGAVPPAALRMLAHVGLRAGARVAFRGDAIEAQAALLGLA